MVNLGFHGRYQRQKWVKKGGYLGFFSQQSKGAPKNYAECAFTASGKLAFGIAY